MAVHGIARRPRIGPRFVFFEASSPVMETVVVLTPDQLWLSVLSLRTRSDNGRVSMICCDCPQELRHHCDASRTRKPGIHPSELHSGESNAIPWLLMKISIRDTK